MDVDNLIADYANRLQSVYNDRTAGAHTFTGILATFLLDVDKAREDDRVAEISTPEKPRLQALIDSPSFWQPYGDDELEFKVGDRVTITERLNGFYSGVGTVTEIDYAAPKPFTVALDRSSYVSDFRANQLALYTDPKGFSEGDWVTIADKEDRYFGHKGYVNAMANDLTVRLPYFIELESGWYRYYAADQLEPTGKSL